MALPHNVVAMALLTAAALRFGKGRALTGLPRRFVRMFFDDGTVRPAVATLHARAHRRPRVDGPGDRP